MAVILRAGRRCTTSNRVIPSNPSPLLPETNACVTEGTNGTLYGATLEDPTFGVIDPLETALGQKVYALTWDVAGEFQMRFGDIGNEPVPDTPNILITSQSGRAVALHWSASELMYIGDNLELATELIADYSEGTVRCMYVQVIPNLFISYDFNMLRRA